MKPKILIFSTAYFPLVGGAEVAVKEITDRLTDFDFEMLTARIRKDLPVLEEIGRVKVRRLGWGTPLDKFYLMFRGGAFASRLQRREKYSATWAIMASYGGFAALAFKKKNPRVPFLLTLQEGDDLKEIENKVRFLSGRFKEIFTRADYLQCISNYLAEWAREIGAKAPLEVIPNGVDLDKFEAQNSKLKIDKKPEEKIIITTSRLVKKNGVGDLIMALTFLPSHIKLWILGVGPQELLLKDMVRENKLEDRVKFFGLVKPEEVAQYLAQADIFCRPSLSEGLGNSFLEAMAAGLPTIGTPVGGIPDFLREGETGFLCEPENPRSVAEKVFYIIDPSNQDEIEKIKIQAEKLVREKYTWTTVSQKMAKIFHNLVTA